jgi:hypothetical protein
VTATWAPTGRGVALATAISCLAGCSTTHVLHLGDPATARQLNEMAVRPSTIAQIAPLAGAAPPAFKYDVVAPAAGGLLVSDGSGAPTFARYDQIQRLQTIDRPRGAREGTLVVGVPALFLGVALGYVVARSAHPDSGSASASDSPRAEFAFGAVFTLIGVVVGAAYGAMAGHRDLYILEP